MIQKLKFIFSLSLISSVLVCLVVSIFVTIVEWIENPSSIFHSESTTNWGFVADTFFSWFWPSLLVVLPISIVLSLIWSKLRVKKNA